MMITHNKLKLIAFNGCNILLAVVTILLVLLFYYHILFDFFSQRFHNGTESIETLSHHKSHENENENEVTTSKRIKRFLVFEGAGVVKLVLGTSFPIVMADRKRSLNYFYNFQMQYTPPNIPLYGWSVFNTTTFMARTNLRKRSIDGDNSRTLIYEIIETILRRSGNVDNDCILKIICEVARAPLEELNNEDDYGRNIYHKLINAIFTPQYSNVDERYLNARVAGQNGANCDETFGKCDFIKKWLKRFTQFI